MLEGQKRCLLTKRGQHKKKSLPNLVSQIKRLMVDVELNGTNKVFEKFWMALWAICCPQALPVLGIKCH